MARQNSFNDLYDLVILKDEKTIVKTILRAPSTLVHASEDQTKGLTLALQQHAKESKAHSRCCVLPISADSEDEFERLLLDNHLDSKTKNLTTIPGPLWQCLEAKDGLLIILLGEDLAPTAEGLNGIFDRSAFYNTHLKNKPINVNKGLKIVAVHTTSNSNSKTPKMSKSQLGRFEQICRLDSKLHLSPPPSLPIFTTKNKEEAKNDLSTYTMIDCAWLSGEDLQSHLLITYFYNEQNQLESKPGKLVVALKQETKSVVFKNLDLTIPSVKFFIDDLMYRQCLNQPLIVNQKPFNLNKIKLFLAPPRAPAELSLQVKGKALAKLTLRQLKIVAEKNRCYWLNQASADELFELSHSVSGKDGFYWKNGPGFIKFFTKENLEIAYVVFRPLARAAWYQLLQHSAIKQLYVLDNVQIPEPFTALFSTVHAEFKSLNNTDKLKLLWDNVSDNLSSWFNSNRLTTKSPPWIYVHVCEDNQQLNAVRGIVEKEKSEAKTVVIHTTPDYDSQLLIKYDEKRRDQEGNLLKDLKAGKTILLTGDALLDQLPNFFSQQTLIQNNEKFISGGFSGKLILVINAKTQQQYPFLTVLPKLPDFEMPALPLQREPKTGYQGLLTCLTERDNWLIFIQGPKASGKTYTFSKNNPDSEILKATLVFKYTFSGASSFTPELASTVKQWAGPISRSDTRLRLLIFDELTLAQPNSLHWLLSFPEICLPNGEKICLDPSIHLVIGIMNPAETTANRESHTWLESVATIVNYPPMTEDDLREKVLIPALQHEWSLTESLAFNYSEELITLGQQVALLEPPLQLNPRDFLALIAKVAATNYKFESKSFEFKDAPTVDREQALLGAIEQVILPQLRPENSQALQAWWTQRLSRPTFQSSLPEAEYANQLFLHCLELWNTRSAQRCAASFLGFMQIFFYYLAKKRFIPGKAGLLITGETNSGKSRISHSLLEIFYDLIKDCQAMTLGAHVDLLELFEQLKEQKNPAPKLFDEGNFASPEALEGLNNHLTGDIDPPITLIMTANIGSEDYQFRQPFSEPLLSRLFRLPMEDFLPEELLRINKISTAKIPGENYSPFEYLLKLHETAGSQGSSRLLLNVINNYQSGNPLKEACAMSYGLLLREKFAEKPTTESEENPYLGYLKLLGENCLIIKFKSMPSIEKSTGQLLRTKGQIILPSLTKTATAAEQQHIYHLILWRTLQFQLITTLITHGTPEHHYPFYETLGELLAFTVISQYYPGCQALAPLLLVEDAKQMSNKSDPLSEWCKAQQQPSEVIAFAALAVNWYVKSILTRQLAPDWLTIKAFFKNDTFDKVIEWIAVKFEATQGSMAKLFEIIQGKDLSPVDAVMVIKINQSSIVKVVNELMQLETSGLKNSQSNMANEFFSFEAVSGSIEEISSTDYSNLVLLDNKSMQKRIYFPTGIYTICSISGLPIHDGSFLLEELPQHFFPKSPQSVLSGEAIEITLTSPKIENHRISLLVPMGFRPNLGDSKDIEDSKRQLTWENGKFYAVCDGFDEKSRTTLTYKVVAADAKDAFPDKIKRAPFIELLIQIEDLDISLRAPLYALQKASTLNTLRMCAEQLCIALKNSLIPLNRESDNTIRQTLLKLYGKNNIIAIVKYCLEELKVVCVEATILFYVLFELFCPKQLKEMARCYLVSGLISECGKMIGHAYPVIQWSDRSYPDIYDPIHGLLTTADAEIETKTETKTENTGAILAINSLFSKPPVRSLVIAPNPLLDSCYLPITQAAIPLFQYLSQLSIKGKRQKFYPVPRGKWSQKHAPLGLPFGRNLFKESWQPQALLFVCAPPIRNHEVDTFIQFSCIELLINLLLENKFTILVWHRSIAHSVTHAHEFISTMQQIRPTKDYLIKFKYPKAYKIIDDSAWREILIQFSHILQTTITDKNKAKYRKNALPEVKAKTKTVNFETKSSESSSSHSPQLKKIPYSFKAFSDYLENKLKGHYIINSASIRDLMQISVVIHHVTVDELLFLNLIAAGTVYFQNCQFDFKNKPGLWGSELFVIDNEPNSIPLINPRVIKISDSPIGEDAYKYMVEFSKANFSVEFENCRFDFLESKKVQQLSLSTNISLKGAEITQSSINSLKYSGNISFYECNFTEKIDFSAFKYVKSIQIQECRGFTPRWNSLQHPLKEMVVFGKFTNWSDWVDDDTETLVNRGKTYKLTIQSEFVANQLNIHSNSALEYLCIDIGQKSNLDVIFSKNLMYVNWASRESRCILFASNFLSTTGQLEIEAEKIDQLYKILHYSTIGCCFIIIDCPDFEKTKQFMQQLVAKVEGRECYYIHPVEAALDFFIKKASLLIPQTQQVFSS